MNYYTDEELFNAEEDKHKNTTQKVINALDNKSPKYDLSMFKHYCWTLGQYGGTAIWLYDNDGVGINDNRTLKSVLNKWGKGLKVYCVPADVHS